MDQEMMSDEQMLAMLRQHPALRESVKSVLGVVNDAGGEFRRADDAERRLREDIRRLGQQAMQGWADRQVVAMEQELRRSGRVHREGKKNSNGTPPSATSA